MRLLLLLSRPDRRRRVMQQSGNVSSPNWVSADRGREIEMDIPQMIVGFHAPYYAASVSLVRL